jgi:hypothetical protein
MGGLAYDERGGIIGGGIWAGAFAVEGGDGLLADVLGGSLARDGADDKLFADRADGCAFGDTASGEM